MLLALFLCTILSMRPAWAESYTVFASNNPPFNYLAEDGSVQGIAVDVLKVLMERSHMPLGGDCISVINWARAVDKTMHESNCILLSPARTPKREHLFSWVGPLHSFQLGLVARKSQHTRIVSPDDLKEFVYGVIRDSAPADILERQYQIPEDLIKPLSNEDQLFKMLERGRVDMVPRGRLSASYWLDRLKLNPADFEIVYTLKELDLYIAFNPMTNPELIQRLNLELRKLKQIKVGGTSEYQKIVNRHIHGGLIPLN